MKNPYAQASLKMLPSFVCYADILGYSALSQEAIRNGDGDGFLKHLRATLTEVYDRLREHSEGISGGHNFYKIKVFTDNIVLGYPLHRSELDYGEPEMADILGTICELQTRLAMEGFLVRGGIAFGQHYMDDDIVFGDALIEAVKRDDSGSAPCISLAPSAVERVRRQLGFYGDDPSHAPHHYHLLEDADGTIFLNYLGEAFCAFPEDGPFFEIIEGHKNTVINGLIKYSAVPGIRSKFEWAARYHNYVCRSFAEAHPISHDDQCDEIYGFACEEAQKLLEYTIDIETLAAMPRRMQLTPIKLCR